MEEFDFADITQKGFPVIEGNEIVFNSEVFYVFFNSTDTSTNRSIRIYQNFKKFGYVARDIFFYDGSYYIFSNLDDGCKVTPYKAIKIFDEPNSHGRGLYRTIVFTNDLDLTYEEYTKKSFKASYTSDYETDKLIFFFKLEEPEH